MVHNLQNIATRLEALASQPPEAVAISPDIHAHLHEAMLLAEPGGRVMASTPEAHQLIGNVTDLSQLDLSGDEGTFRFRTAAGTVRYVEYRVMPVTVGDTVCNTRVTLHDVTARTRFLRQREITGSVYQVISKYAVDITNSPNTAQSLHVANHLVEEVARNTGALDVSVVPVSVNEGWLYGNHPTGMFGKVPQMLLVEPTAAQVFGKLARGEPAVQFTEFLEDTSTRHALLQAEVDSTVFVPVMVQSVLHAYLAFHFEQSDFSDTFHDGTLPPLQIVAGLYAGAVLAHCQVMDFNLLATVTVADSLPAPMCFLSQAGNLVYRNAAFLASGLQLDHVDPDQLPSGDEVAVFHIQHASGTMQLNVTQSADPRYPYVGVPSALGDLSPKSNIFLREALDALRTPLLLTDRLGVIVYANVLAKDLLGGTLEFPTDKFWEAIQQRELTCAKERSSVCYPDFLNNVPYSVSLTALTDKTDYRGCLILLQPATSDDYHRVLANVPVGILSVDENNVVTFANTAANTLLQSLSVTKLSDMIHPSYHVLLANRLAALRDGQHLGPAMYRLRNKKYVEMQSVRVTGVKESTIHVVMRDLLVDMLESPLQTSLNATPFPVFVVDASGCVVFANQQAKAAGWRPPFSVAALGLGDTFESLAEEAWFSGQSAAHTEHGNIVVQGFGDISAGMVMLRVQ